MNSDDDHTHAVYLSKRMLRKYVSVIEALRLAERLVAEMIDATPKDDADGPEYCFDEDYLFALRCCLRVLR